MADVRITSGSRGLAPMQPAGRAEAVKAAQRAFFNAALVQAQAPVAVKAAATAAAPPQPHVTRLTASVVDDPAPAGRMLRPGSLLDIKV